MKVQDDLRREQRQHANISLAVAVGSALIAALITYLSANLGATATRESTESQIRVQMEMTKMQIEASKEIARIEASKPFPPIVVQIPEAVKRVEKK